MGVALRVEKLVLKFEGLTAVDEVDLEVPEGGLAALVGPNGAGKTSLLNCVSGVYHPTAGAIHLAGRRIDGLPPHQIAALGVGRTFQFVELFRHMTVLENLLLGRHLHMRTGVLAGGLFWGPARREEAAQRERVEAIIDFLELERQRKELIGNLPYGIQKLVGVGRALAMEPRLLLLDEPSTGMNRQEKEDLARFLLRIKHERDVTILWVEHDMQLVGDLADRMAVLHYGRKIAEGTAQEVLNDPAVVEAYLGVSRAS